MKSKKGYVLFIICSIAIMAVLFTACQKDEVKEKAAELSKEYNKTEERVIAMYNYYENWQDVEFELKEEKYILSDEEILEAVVNSGVRLDEISELVCIARDADISIRELIELKKSGKSMKKIREQFPSIMDDIEERKNEDRESLNDGLSNVYTHPNRIKESTNYKISDFVSISKGMSAEKVREILEGRQSNGLYDPMSFDDIYVRGYELMTGGVVTISYDFQGVYAMNYYVGDKSIKLIDRANTEAAKYMNWVEGLEEE